METEDQFLEVIDEISSQISQENPPLPSKNKYPYFEKYDELNRTIQESFNILELGSLLNSIKKETNLLQFNLSNRKNVVIFGAGGTTSWFLPKLLKLYNDAFHKQPNFVFNLNIVLVDGDITESKNILRQNFISEDVGFNKAEVLSNRYNDLYPNISVSFIPKFATSKLFDNTYLPNNKYDPDLFLDISELNLSEFNIINLVDNEGFKKKLDFILRKEVSIYSNSHYFSAGVNLFNGQVYHSPLNRFSNGYVNDHEDLFEIFDEVSVHTCADTDANGTEDNPDQLFNGNDLAASLLANLYQTYLNDILMYNKIHFTSGSNINVKKGEPCYASLTQMLIDHPLKDDEITKAQAYVSRYGNDRKTKMALHFYEILDKNLNSKFVNIVTNVLNSESC